MRRPSISAVLSRGCRPGGLDGGLPGGLGRIELGEGERLSGRNGILAAGQMAAAVTSGGGGFGDPKERDRDLVRRDLPEGRISGRRRGISMG